MAASDGSGSGFVRRAVTLAFLVVIAAFITGGLAILDHDTVRDKQDLARVSFGIPVEWLHQDDSALEPPVLPYRQAPESPQDYPTTISAAPLALTIAGVTAIEVVLLYGTSVLFRRGRPGR